MIHMIHMRRRRKTVGHIFGANLRHIHLLCMIHMVPDTYDTHETKSQNGSSHFWGKSHVWGKFEKRALAHGCTDVLWSHALDARRVYDLSHFSNTHILATVNQAAPGKLLSDPPIPPHSGRKAARPGADVCGSIPWPRTPP